jgi:hypothetical protein
MAVTLSSELTTIVNCDDTTNWVSSNTISADTEVYKEGTASIGLLKTSEATVYAIYDYYTANGVYLDLTDTHIYFWYRVAITIDTQANGGIQIYVEDSAAEWRKWYVGGSDNYYGGWQCYVVHTGETPDESSAGAINFAQIAKIGFYSVVLGKTVVNANNMWCDIYRYGKGLIATGGTDTDPATFDDIATADDAAAYGVVVKRYGTFIFQGPLTIGDEVGTASTYFKDTSQIVLFSDARVSATHYDIKVTGNTTGTTKVYFGSKSGTAGISGCIFKSVGAKKFTVTATNANITELGIYGCSFLDASTISLPAYSTTREVLSTNFEASAEVLADTCIVQYCKFINADDIGVRISSTDHNITDCDFISCVHGVNIPNIGTYTFDALKFTGNTYDIENSSTGAVTVNCVNGSNPSTVDNTAGGTTDIVNTVYLTVNVEDEDGNPVENAAVAIYKSLDNSELMNQLTDVNGQAQTTYNYTGDVDIYVRIRKSSPGATRYIPYTTSGTITSSGYTLTAVLIADLVAA